MPFCSGVEGEKWNFLMIDLRDDLVTGYLMPPMLISNVLDMTYWPARTYLKIIDHMLTLLCECGHKACLWPLWRPWAGSQLGLMSESLQKLYS